MLKNYCYLNHGLQINFAGEKLKSKNGLLDLLQEKILDSDSIYSSIHIKSDDCELAFTHSKQNSEEYYSFVNGQFTSMGGTHQAAFKEAIVKVIRDHYKKEFNP